MTLAALRQALHRAVPTLGVADQDSILKRATGWSRSELYSHPERRADPQAQNDMRRMQRQLLQGTPLELVLGHCHFAGLDLQVRPDVLVPRTETEGLVAIGLELLPMGGSLADLGTGSGAIALAVCKQRPDATVTAVDINPQALALAADNARRLGLEICWLLGDWCAPLAGQCFDVLLTNPPYVESGYGGLPELLRHEPEQALVAGPTGLEAIEQIATEVSGGNCLHSGGWLVCEHAADRGKAVRDLLAGRGFADCFTRTDQAGLERHSGGRLGR